MQLDYSKLQPLTVHLKVIICLLIMVGICMTSWSLPDLPIQSTGTGSHVLSPYFLQLHQHLIGYWCIVIQQSHSHTIQLGRGLCHFMPGVLQNESF